MGRHQQEEVAWLAETGLLQLVAEGGGALRRFLQPFTGFLLRGAIWDAILGIYNTQLTWFPCYGKTIFLNKNPVWVLGALQSA